jgi:ABC-2 type transport system permease protein
MTIRTLAVGLPGIKGNGVTGVYRAELRKLLTQLSTRVLALVCVLGPFAFALVLSEQSGVPADTLLGVWVHSSGYAVSFVVLGFADYLGLPVVAGVLAGDLFSSEDRYGTWKLVLTRSRTRKDVFLGKVLAAGSIAVALVLLAGVSSLVAGLLLTGDGPLVGLSGTLVPSSEALWLVLASWLLTIPPTLAFTSLAVLLSVVTRNGIVGVLGPVLIALAMGLLALIGSGSVVHTLLVASAFADWHGLLTIPKFYLQLIIGSGVSVLWMLACLWASWRVLQQRDFAGPPVTRRPGWVTPVRTVLGAAAILALLAAATSIGPVPITKARLEASIGRAFNSLTVLQLRELGRTVPAGTELDPRTKCSRHSGKSQGPGEDWTCTLTLAASEAGYNPIALTAVTYDVGVKSEGCYKADAPPSFVGQQNMTNAKGHSVVNPLFTMYGCFDPTATVHCPELLKCAAAKTKTQSETETTRARSHEPAPRVQKAARETLRSVERKLGSRRINEINEAEKKILQEQRAPETKRHR